MINLRTRRNLSSLSSQGENLSFLSLTDSSIYYYYISPDTTLQGPKSSFAIKEAFNCRTTGLVYGISCRRCPAIYIGETGRTLGQRFGEHLRSIEKNLPGFPVAEHFNTNGNYPGRKSPWNYALRRKQATKASGDAPYFQTRHQSAARNELRLPISLGRHAHIARARYNFKSDFIAQASFLT